MVAQSFLYNSVFFTFGLILAHFYKVQNERVGFYLFVLAIGNFCGPLLLGSLFDTIGRKKMIAGTFAISGILLLITAYMFGAGLLSVAAQTAAWFAIFFFASAAASSAYLTASEIFPLETRALAIACHVGHWDELDGLVAASYDTFGRVDVLVNNAGMSLLYDSVETVTETMWDKVVDLNLKGPFRLTALVGSRMADGPYGGSIINISSTGSIRPAPSHRSAT